MTRRGFASLALTGLILCTLSPAQAEQKLGYIDSQVLREKLPEFKDIPIIALTAYAMKEDKEKTLKVGCNDYISKPIIPKKFIKVVNSYLRE